MSDDAKKGIFSRFFGNKQSCCCNVEIEEVPEDQAEDAKEDQPQATDNEKCNNGGSCCCG